MPTPARRRGRSTARREPQRLQGLEESGARAAAGKTLVIADGGYLGTGLIIPHRRVRGRTELPDRKEEDNRSYKQIRARVEHAFARTKTWKILRDCRLKGDGVHHALLGSARMHNLALVGQARATRCPTPRWLGDHSRDSP